MAELTKWERVVPGRLEQVTDTLRKLTRTGAKDYEPIDEHHAQEMLTLVQEAVKDLLEAYRPYLGDSPQEGTQEPAAASAPPPVAVSPLDNPHAIAFFVNQIQKEHLTIWSAHLCNRICDELIGDTQRSPKSKSKSGE